MIMICKQAIYCYRKLKDIAFFETGRSLIVSVRILPKKTRQETIYSKIFTEIQMHLDAGTLCPVRNI